MLRNASFVHVALVSLVALAGCSQEDAGRPCETLEQCPAQARCIDQLCVADTPPVATIQGLDQFAERALATFDGSDSEDADPGDAVAAWRWTVRAVEAACAAPAALPPAPTIHVRFPCAGRWEVELVVADALGVESAPKLHEVTVVEYAGAPPVTAGEDVALEHRCSGEPVRCTPVDAEEAEVAIALGAEVTAPDLQAGSVTYRWSVTPPPGLAVSAGRRVAFVPGPDVAAPEVRLETDGLAIAGQWLFTLEVADAAGVIGSATQVVTVGNRPPELTATVPATVPHRYDVSRRFIASGEIPITVVDPDGDPVSRRPPIARHLNDGAESVFDVADAGDVLTYYVSVKYETPADALLLIGEGVVRELELTVDDVNGATATRTLPLVVGNRPPRAVSTVAAVTTGHHYDAEAAAYRAEAKLTTWVDDDGDPLVQAGPTGDAACAELVVDPDGQASVRCALPFAGSPSAGQFAVSHLVQQRVMDPWTEAEAIAPASVTITNRPPVVTLESFPLTTTCETDTGTCCELSDLGGCAVYLRRFGAGTAVITPTITDPDGDPLELQVSACGSVSPVSQVCFGDDCGPFTVTSCEVSTCDLQTDDPRGLRVRASDGGALDDERLPFTQDCI